MNEIEPEPEWKGLHPKKFSLKQKKHYAYDHQDQFVEVVQKRHYPQTNNFEKEQKQGIKSFPDLKNALSPLKPLRTLNELNPPPHGVHYDTKEIIKHLHGEQHLSVSRSLPKLPTISQSLNNHIFQNEVKRSKESANEPYIMHEEGERIKASDILSVFLSNENHKKIGNKSTIQYTPKLARSMDIAKITAFRANSIANIMNANNKKDRASSINFSKSSLNTEGMSRKFKENLESIEEDEKNVKDLDNWDKSILPMDTNQETDTPRTQTKIKVKNEKKLKPIEIYENLRARKLTRKQKLLEFSANNDLNESKSP